VGLSLLLLLLLLLLVWMVLLLLLVRTVRLRVLLRPGHRSWDKLRCPRNAGTRWDPRSQEPRLNHRITQMPALVALRRHDRQTHLCHTAHKLSRGTCQAPAGGHYGCCH
jgi:hypothetical protein